MTLITDLFPSYQRRGLPSPEGNPKVKSVFEAGDSIAIDMLTNVRYVPVAPWDPIRIRLKIDKAGTLNLVFVDQRGQELGPGVRASETLTLTGQPLNNETVVIDTKTYTFQTTLSDVDGNVLIGASAAASLSNLQQAINLDPSGAGTLYAASMTLHPTAYADNLTPTTLDAVAKSIGTAGNSIATTETLTNGSWGGATMSGGVDGDITADGTAIVADTPLTVNIPGTENASPEHVGEPWLKVYVTAMTGAAAVTYFDAMGWYG